MRFKFHVWARFGTLDDLQSANILFPILNADSQQPWESSSTNFRCPRGGWTRPGPVKGVISSWRCGEDSFRVHRGLDSIEGELQLERWIMVYRDHQNQYCRVQMILVLRGSIQVANDLTEFENNVSEYWWSLQGYSSHASVNAARGRRRGKWWGTDDSEEEIIEENKKLQELRRVY